jgi:hypothetical protein
MSTTLQLGSVSVGGRAWIAPMTGVSDLPFRRAASRLGAAYVATEMVACAEFSKGRPDVVRRAAVGEGLPLMVVQLVGREPAHIAEGAKLAAQAGAQVIDLKLRLPGQGSDRRAVRLGLDARPRTCWPADGRRRRSGRCAGHGQDAPGLGRRLEERAGNRRQGTSRWASAPSRSTAARAASSTRAPPTGAPCAPCGKPSPSP